MCSAEKVSLGRLFTNRTAYLRQSKQLSKAKTPYQTNRDDKQVENGCKTIAIVSLGDISVFGDSRSRKCLRRRFGKFHRTFSLSFSFSFYIVLRFVKCCFMTFWRQERGDLHCLLAAYTAIYVLNILRFTFVYYAVDIACFRYRFRRRLHRNSLLHSKSRAKIAS